MSRYYTFYKIKSKGEGMEYNNIMLWNGNEIVFSDNPQRGVAGIAQDQGDDLAREIIRRWNLVQEKSEENVCNSCRYDNNDCPARSSAGDFAYALACVWRKPKLRLIITA